MLIGISTLFIAVLISCVSAYYSILGLTAIFAGAVVPAILMGSVLEAGKVMVAIWLHQNWNRDKLLKYYLVPALIFLMMLTSIGVFGFLSKAHLDQAVPSGDIQAQVQLYDEQIQTQRDNIKADRVALAQMDSAVDQLMSRSTTEAGADRAANLRRSQARERAGYQADILKAQREIGRLEQERAPIASQYRKVEAEVGPIKYVAALFSSGTPDQDMLERAVRWVIILIVVVFDPLAIVLIIAGITQLDWAKSKSGSSEWIPSPSGKTIDELIEEITPENLHPETTEYTPDDSRLTDEQIAQINQHLKEEVERVFLEENFIDEPIPDTPAVDEHPFRGQGIPPGMPMTASYIQPRVEKDIEPMPDVEVIEQHAQEPVLITRIAYPESTIELAVTPEEEIVQQQVTEAYPDIDLSPTAAESVTTNPWALDERPGDYVEPPTVETMPEPIPEPLPARTATAEFGSTFPNNPGRGDLFMRTDFKPHRAFKWNDVKWIEVNKNATDVFNYNDAYIQFLTEKLSTGEYSLDDLSEREVQQVRSMVGGRLV